MAIQKTEKIWHNGKLIPWDNATIHVMSHVVHYGSSVFEGIRCYALPSGPAIFRANEHMQRLLDSAKIYRIDVDYTRDELVEGMVETGQEQRRRGPATSVRSSCADTARRESTRSTRPPRFTSATIPGENIWATDPEKASTSAFLPGRASRPTRCPRWPSRARIT